MAYQDWVSLVNDSVQAIGAGAVLNTAATATISPTTGVGVTADVAVMPAASSPGGWDVGMAIRYTARGYITTVATSGTLTFLLAANKTNNGTYTTLATTAGITTGTTVLTGLQWKLEAVTRCTAVASAGNTLSTQGELTIMNNVTAPTLNAQTNGVLLVAAMPNVTGESAAAIDLTQVQGLCLRCTQATSTCTVQLTSWLVEQLN